MSYLARSGVLTQTTAIENGVFAETAALFRGRLACSARFSATLRIAERLCFVARGRAHGTEGALVAVRDGHQGEGGDGTRAPSNSRSAPARRVSETRLTSASSASGGWPGGHRSSQCRCASGRGRPTYLVGAVGRAWPPTTPFHERRDRCERHFDVGDLRGLPGALAKIWRGCPTRSVGRRTPGPFGSGLATPPPGNWLAVANGQARSIARFTRRGMCASGSSCRRNT
jgi:hypothetical protein